MAIDVVLWRVAHSETVYQTTITNRAMCDAILKELKLARFVGLGAKPDGELSIRYTSGKVDRVQFIWSDIKEDCLFFYHGFYRVSGERFFGTLNDAGVDVFMFRAKSLNPKLGEN